MLIKLGVDISRLKPPIRKKLKIIDDIFDTYDTEAVITSTYEGTHGANSLHYANLAIDFRTSDLCPDDDKFVAHALEVKLGNDYDIVVKPNHIHIEYDPKGLVGHTTKVGV